MLAAALNLAVVLWDAEAGFASEPGTTAGIEEIGKRRFALDHVRSTLEAFEYRAHDRGPGLQAPNRRHRFRTWFGHREIRIADRAASDRLDGFSIAFEAFGRAGHLSPVAPGTIAHAGSRVEIRRPTLVEWYVNDPRGLEQGFTIERRPDRSGPITLEFAVEGAEARQKAASLRFELPTGRAYDYGKLFSVDAGGRSLPIAVQRIAPDRFQIRVEDEGALYPITIDPLIQLASDTKIVSDQAAALFGFSAATAGDVNGDGYDDLIVGAPQYDSGVGATGAAFVFHGGPNGLVGMGPATADTHLWSSDAGPGFGLSVAGAGDINGDGLDDVIVGDPTYTDGQIFEGGAFVFHGAPGGIADTDQSGAATRIQSDQPGALLGSGVSRAGDVNGDGFEDVIVAALQFDAGEADEGAAFVFHGSVAGIADGNAASAEARLEADQAGALLGHGIGGAGDVNGDGYDDVVVGAPRYDAGEGYGEGIALVFHGGPSGVVDGDPASAATLLQSNAGDSRFGCDVGGAGDVNGDGFDDVIVGAWRYPIGPADNIGGSAFVFHGGATGIPDATPATANARLESERPNRGMGESVAGAGDVNGDGFDDVVVGATTNQIGMTLGSAFVFVGSANGVGDADPETAAASVSSGMPTIRFGQDVATAGDLNADGFDDVVVGAPDAGIGPLSGGGSANVFIGRASLPEPTASIGTALGVATTAAWTRHRRRSPRL